MDCRVRFLSRVDRPSFNEKPVGLQRYGGRDFDRRLFIVRLFHGAESRARAIANTVSAVERQATTSIKSLPFSVVDLESRRDRGCLALQASPAADAPQTVRNRRS